MSTASRYEELIRRAKEWSLLGSCSALLGWDEQTYMPRGGTEHRGEQSALLAGLRHDRATDPRVGELLGLLETEMDTSDPVSPESVNLRELRRTYDRSTKLPRRLVEEMARATTLAQQEWVTARQKKDFQHFRPHLETLVRLKREEAECYGYEDEAYDALLDEYEPGASSKELAGLFAAIRKDLVPLVAAIQGSSKRPDSSILKREYPVDRQRVFGEAAAAAFGFDFERGRLDVTEHPFCTTIGPGDCRITTRFNIHNFEDAFFGILHETGHGLYEQGLLAEHAGTPMGEAVSLGVHESQSRMWENLVGRGRAFWTYWFPQARRVFRDALHDVDPDTFLCAINEVQPSLIRVQADEVTYNLHIFVRFELEKAILSGDLPVADVPGVWNETYTRDLGVTPKDDSEGCLQDIHWSAGLFGYFPTYTLGNVFAAQFFAKAKSDLGDLDHAFAQGDYKPLLDWLRANIHQHGQRYRSADLVKVVTGQAPDPKPLVESLRSKYAPLYGL